MPEQSPAATTHSGAPAACLEWGVFAGAAIARADEAIANLGLPDTQVRRTVADADLYWVFVPPAKTKSGVSRNIAALREAGITDFFVVQGQGQWRNSISLGIFKSEDSAKRFLASVAAKGITSASAGKRENGRRQITYFLHEPTQSTVAKLAELQREFPGSKVKAVVCPPPEAAAGS